MLMQGQNIPADVMDFSKSARAAPGGLAGQVNHGIRANLKHGI